MYFTSGSDRAFEQLMQTRPGADHFDSGEAGAPEDCGTCRFYRPHWKYQFCVYEECPYLLRLKEHGIKLAVATGLPEKLYMPCLKNNSILELFDALCSTDEVQRGKEYSDVFELAAKKLGVAPEHCIVFDDVLPAIKSAKAARMLAGGIYDKYSADQRAEIERIADIYLLDFRQAPIPHKEA